ncbi:protein of unknown function DUF309 [Chloroherpeton thalassium ATCC 35110]|uniref:DUF309 domain-containing protein n=1 Tax=Chloroherpeton thalassium (strain ATCC 35110 / GB-78) TaxID=517418 RepID=B3QS36_CHLT3|nr:DUF309 domain-containing protein [Chloroherpeton thalassium]ACF13981.1 protein of unknown function DUF309 [Chloroherpeton thalassium ATCC 35110]
MTLDDCYENFLTGIKQYNNKDFFESHDTWEEIWHELRGTDRLFVQGLIHSAIGLYHLSNGNWKGARHQFEKCEKKLSAYLPAYRGLNVQAFLKHHELVCLPLTHKIEKNEPVQLLESVFPKIELSNAAVESLESLTVATQKIQTACEQARVQLAARIEALEAMQQASEKRVKMLQEKFEQQLSEIQRRENRLRRNVYFVLGVLITAFLAAIVHAP